MTEESTPKTLFEQIIDEMLHDLAQHEDFSDPVIRELMQLSENSGLKKHASVISALKME